MASNLSEFYTGQGQQIPSIQSRGQLYQQYGLGDAQGYQGTAQQNEQLLSHLQGTQPKTTQPQKPQPQQGQQQGQQQPQQPVQAPTDPTTLKGYTQATEEYQNNLQQGYQDFQNLTKSIMSGAIPLTPQQQTLLNSIQNSFASSIQQQDIANKSLAGAAREQAATTGLERFNPTQAAAQVNLAVQTGIGKVQDLQNQMTASIAQMQQQFQDNQLKAARDSYNDFLTMQQDQQAAMKDIYDTVYQHQKDLRDYNLEAAKFVGDYGMTPGQALAGGISGGTPISQTVQIGGGKSIGYVDTANPQFKSLSVGQQRVLLAHAGNKPVIDSETPQGKEFISAANAISLLQNHDASTPVSVALGDIFGSKHGATEDTQLGLATPVAGIQNMTVGELQGILQNQMAEATGQTLSEFQQSQTIDTANSFMQANGVTNGDASTLNAASNAWGTTQ